MPSRSRRSIQPASRNIRLRARFFEALRNLQKRIVFHTEFVNLAACLLHHFRARIIFVNAVAQAIRRNESFLSFARLNLSTFLMLLRFRSTG